MFKKGRKSISKSEILAKVSESDIIFYYLGITKIPTIINSPLREDKKPSFGLYSPNGHEINYRDFSTNDGGSLFKLLSLLWNLPMDETLEKIYKDMPKFGKGGSITKATKRNCIITALSNTNLESRQRDWKDYDLEYWNTYGISLEWLKFADIYPISHIIITNEKRTFTIPADKYAYTYIEFKEGKMTQKIYQPFNTEGYKWSNKHDGSVISLWTKVPKEGEMLCICSSVKDALCLWANTGIPAICTQGEGYGISETAIKELRRRFKNIFIMLDNDKPGIEDAKKLSETTGFTNIELPQFEGGKDISDFYKVLQDKNKFKQSIISLFKDKFINY